MYIICIYISTYINICYFLCLMCYINMYIDVNWISVCWCYNNFSVEFHSFLCERMLIPWRHIVLLYKNQNFFYKQIYQLSRFCFWLFFYVFHFKDNHNLSCVFMQKYSAFNLFWQCLNNKYYSGSKIECLILFIAKLCSLFQECL